MNHFLYFFSTSSRKKENFGELYTSEKRSYIICYLPNSRQGNGGTTPGELILIAKDHREPSTEPSANLVGILEGDNVLKKAVVFGMGLVLSLSIMVGSASAETSLESKVDDLMGVAYKYAGTTTKGFDCSGFTRYVFGDFEIDLAHSSKTQATAGSWVDKDNLRAGDLVFFNTDGVGISHVGIYLGDGEFAHSASNKGVTTNRLSDSYYSKRYVTARRVLSDEQYSQWAEAN